MRFAQPTRRPELDEWLRRRWALLWALILVAPAALAVTSLTPTAAATAIVVCFGIAAATALAMTADSVRTVPTMLPAAVRFGACSTVTCLGFGGLFAHAGPKVWVVIAAYVTTAAWARFSRSTSPMPAAAVPREPEEPTALPHVVTPDEVEGMTDAELCLTWRRSFVTLSSTPDVARRAGLVRLRQVLLDEMEARHPDGLRAWLRSGARAAGGPDRFLGRSDEAGPRQAA